MKHNYPFTKQEGLKDCGAASLQMIIKYYGGYISLEELNDLLETNQQGTSAFNLIEIAKKIGFEAYGIKICLADMNKENLICPFIVHTTIDNKYNHFMVVYEIDFKRKKIVLADPQTSLKKMTFNEFKKIYNGVSLIFYPLKPIIRNNEVSVLKIVLEIAKKHFKDLKYLVFMSLILIIFSIVPSFYMKIMYDNIDMSKDLLFIIFFLFALMNIFKIIANYLRTKIFITLNKKISLEIYMDACAKIINLPYRYYKNKTTGEMLSKVLELEKLQNTINKITSVVLIDLPLAIISGIVLFYINYSMFLISLIFIGAFFLILLFTRKIVNKLTEDTCQKRAEFVSYLEECISGFETIKGLNIENKVIKNNEKKYIKFLNNVTRLDSVLNLQISSKELVSIFLELLITLMGILLVKQNKMTIGDLLAFNSMQIFFFTPIRNILDLDIYIIEAKKIVKKVYEMFEEKRKKNLNVKIINNIKIKKLRYECSNKTILKNINLNFNKGDKVMILGDSGSGKSTLLKVLMGYLNVDRGMAEYNGIDVNDLGNLRTKITYISQNEMLFTDSINNNVKMFDNSEFNDIAKDFYLDEIVKNNSLGYNMVIEENGFNISGGQKQRIVLSRACMKYFDVLLIDEGLNQIDINLERKILKKLFRRYNDKIIIIVSHRKDNMDLYDRIVELKEGRITRNVYRNGKYRYL